MGLEQGSKVVLFGSFARVTSIYLHGADAPHPLTLGGNLERGEKGPCKGVVLGPPKGAQLTCILFCVSYCLL